MAVREDLEAALDAAPRDAAAFLVYADWLLEHGEPHGELIRVEHALSLKPNDLTLKARDEVLRRHLVPALAKYESRWELGFPRHVAITWVTDEELPRLDAALRSPICRFLEGVTLTDYVTPRDVLAPLAELPGLEDVTLTGSLELISPTTMLRMIDQIVRLPRMSRLTLHARQVTEPLDKLDRFPRVQRLTLSGAWLGPEDAQALRRVRERVAPGCVLRLEQTSLSFDTERRVRDVWPFETEGSSEPGLLIEEPEAERGRYLLAGNRNLRIGSHLACDLPIAGHGLNAVHFIFDGASLREAGDLRAPKRKLLDGERVTAGNVTLRFCNDVASARLALQRQQR